MAGIRRAARIVTSHCTSYFSGARKCRAYCTIYLHRTERNGGETIFRNRNIPLSEELVFETETADRFQQ